MASATLKQSSQASMASVDVPVTQNTAPVLEFRCLYTSDLRRKQKRWQDGRLKFHTFNKRVMVYDERSNFVGDTHWRKDYEFEEGEELELERGGIMVEVGECMGKRDQDLSELVDKRVKEREERAAAKHAATPMRPQASFNPQTPAGSALLRPKSLNAVLGNPTGHFGKAVIPSLSPFEQRQQTSRDEVENERPAKRRKQDGTPPSKNGYAQSLMGTKLTLASSRPPSTASIKYEPFRPSFHRTPAGIIDLTEDDDGYETPDKMRPDSDKEERQVQRSQRRRLHKSPPARSGYASNLTGASLSLNNPERFASKRAVLGFGLSRKGIRQVEETGSSPLESHTLVEDAASEERPTKMIQEQQEPIKQRTKPRPDRPDFSRSSSPPVMSRPVKLLKSTPIVNKDKASQDSSVSRLPDRPGSTLRIKSRAPRKMMMLMDRPIPRSPAPTESSDDIQTASSKLQGSKLAPPEVVLSQATVRLDAFRERQEQRLQGRLNGKGSNLDSDECSSSPADIGIDHRMIDSLLSHTTTQPKRVLSEAAVEGYELTPVADPERGSKDEEVARVRKPSQPRASMDAGVTSNAIVHSKSSRPDSYSPNNASKDAQILRQQASISPKLPLPSTTANSDTIISMAPFRSVAQQSRQPQTRENPDARSRSTIPSTAAATDIGASPSEILVSERIAEPSVKSLPAHSAPKSTSPDPPPAPVNQLEQDFEVNEREMVVPRQRRGSPQTTEPSSEAANSPTVDKISSSDSHSPIANVRLASIDRSGPPTNSPSGIIPWDVEMTTTVPDMQTRISRRSPIARPKAPSLPAHFSSSITSATEHLHSILKCSATPLNPGFPQPLDTEHHTLPPASVLEIQKEAPLSSEVVIKVSPKGSPPLAEGVSSEAQGGEAGESTTGIGNNAGPTIPTVPNSRKPQPKAKLANPATRGPSVLITANRTVNALVPTLNGLLSMPPPPRTSIRPGRTLGPACVENSTKGPAKEVTAGGPWSRESFDLFGTWKPPGRDTGTSSVNG